MLHDLDETLKQLLIQKAGLDPAEVDISFDIPTRDWSTPVTRPTVNLYLYDIRENLKLRELYWDEEVRDNGKIRLKRRPLRVDVSYMITCWTSTPEDQHRLLWRVLETLFRYSPLPEDILQGSLKNVVHVIRTEVAQPDGVFQSAADFWGALENQLRPSIGLVVTLDLDLEQVQEAPIVFAKMVKIGGAVMYRDVFGVEYPLEQLQPGWEAAPVQLGGLVHDPEGRPLPGAAVRLIGKEVEGRPIQVGPTIHTDAEGRYIFHGIPPGEYTLVVEVAGQAPQQHPLTLTVRERGEALPEFIQEVEVPMKK
jgi:hypothetical protein